MPACVFVLPRIPAASTTPQRSPPNRYARMTPGPGSKPRCSTVASVARSATKTWWGLHWRRGGGQIPLRLLVMAPTPYRKRKSSRLYYRQPAYLLTTDLNSSARQLLQIYFDRWQIEINHRDEKDTLGVGQAQLRNVDAVPKQPVLVVAAYSALLLASLQAFGIERGQAYQPCRSGAA